MCRFVVYMGEKSILISDILIKPEHSLIKQSLSSRETHTITNGDGFGLGWYTGFSKYPALFTSLFPAWNDRNLSYLARKTKASLFFAHVRAATCGGVSQFNCHPFLYKNWMFMHNGIIAHFEKIKRELQQLLDDDVFKWLKGSTDSELIFALFLHLIKNSKMDNGLEIATKLQETLSIIENLVKKYDTRSVSYFNICITDGKRLVASRYCSSKHTKPETMYLSLDKISSPSSPYLVVASEKLTQTGWAIIPADSFLIIEPNFEVSFQKFR